MSDNPTAWFGVFDPQGELHYVGKHDSHIGAWVGFFQGAVPYGAIIAKQTAGWSAKLVEVTPKATPTVVRLPQPMRAVE